MHQRCPLKCVWKLNVQEMKTQVSYTSKNTQKIRFMVIRGRNRGGETGWGQLEVQTSSYKILTTRDVMHSLINAINPAVCHQRRHWHGEGTPVLLPGKSHGWRSLVGCSPLGHGESDTTERLHFHFSLRTLEWIAISFSRGSSQSRARNRVSCIAHRQFTIWATREVQRSESFLKEIRPQCSLKGLILEAETPIVWSPDAELTHLKRPWCSERLKAGGDGVNRVWDGWMASLTQWRWV